jgi:hypothetical protein
MSGAGGWLWSTVTVFGVLVLGFALIYGVQRASRRTNNVKAPEYKESERRR